MSTSLSAIVVAHRSARDLERTLRALEAQRLAADRCVVVAVGGDATVRDAARAAEPELLVAVEADDAFGDAVDAAVAALGKHAGTALEGWLWLLEAGDEPEPDALARLRATIERNPSLEVTGPKLVRADDETVIAELGRATTRSGEAVRLHVGELDQGQFDDTSDVLAVARNGMLVRAATWVDLDGFDPGLRDADDALDFSTRAWLADGRVIVTPDARVRVPARPEPSARAARTAQLHRGIASAGPVEAALRRLWLVPGALIAALWHLVRKRPGRILPDLAAAIDVATGRTRVGAARARSAATVTQPPRVIERLQVPAESLRRERAIARDERRLATRDERDRYALVGSGGAWVLLAAAVASVALLLPVLGRTSLAGGALLPLSTTIGELWSHVGYGVRDVASGAFGVADPFALVLALLGTATFWQPSLAVVALWLLAMPLAALTAWFLAARLTRRGWLRAVAAFTWMLAPPLTTALADGRIAGVLVHVLLPLLLFCGMRGAHTWAGVAQAALVAAAVLACAPSLLPILALLWLVALVAARRHWYRQLLLGVPALALFAPLAVAQWNRGRPLALLADPGLPFVTDPVRGAAVALGLPDARLGGWARPLVEWGAQVPPAALLAAGLLPVAMLAAVGIVSAAWRTAAWSLALAVAAFAWAVVCGGIAVATSGAQAVPLSLGPAQSLMLLGLLGAALAGLATVRRARLVAAVAALAGIAALATPSALAHLDGQALVADGAGRALPAIVEAQAAADEAIGTLIIQPLADNGMRVRLDRGAGETLDEQSTLRSTSPFFTDVDQRLAELAVTLASSSTATPTGELHALGIAFVLVERPAPDATAIATRLTSSLDANPAFQSAGETGVGSVWRIVNPTVSPADTGVAGGLQIGNVDTVVGRGILIALAVIVLATVLLALPTGAPPTRAELAVARERPVRLTLDPPPGARTRRFGVPAAEAAGRPGYDGDDSRDGRDGSDGVRDGTLDDTLDDAERERS